MQLAQQKIAVLYVGEQQADFEAARAAGTRFLGVSYGWGFDGEEPDMAIAAAPQAIAGYVLGEPS